jgi:small subunit ribosomal protein S5
MIGQSKGKFGGGSRRLFKQTQKKTPEGNKPSFSSFAVVGDGDGHVGGGLGKSKDTLPAREKAVRAAKLAVFRIRRGCGSWECGCRTPHSIPFAVEGKCGSVHVRLMPAPKGKGLTIEKECQKVLRLAGIKDVWSKTSGQTRVKQNLVFALLAALRQLSEVKLKHAYVDQLGMIEGSKR